MPRLHFTHRLASQVEAGIKTFDAAASELMEYANRQNPNGLTLLGAQIELRGVLDGELV